MTKYTLGQNITAGQMVGQINDLSDFKIEAMIDEHYIDRVTNDCFTDSYKSTEK